MKKSIRLFPVAVMVAFSFIGCTKSNSTLTSATDSTSANPSATIVQGQWFVSSFSERTEDKASQLSGVVFTFTADGKITAVNKSGDVEQGSWSYVPSSVGYYGGTPTKSSMTLNMGTSSTFKRLTRTWNILSTSGTTLSLINPEPSNDERLVFTRQ